MNKFAARMQLESIGECTRTMHCRPQLNLLYTRCRGSTGVLTHVLFTPHSFTTHFLLPLRRFQHLQRLQQLPRLTIICILVRRPPCSCRHVISRDSPTASLITLLRTTVTRAWHVFKRQISNRQCRSLCFWNFM